MPAHAEKAACSEPGGLTVSAADKILRAERLRIIMTIEERKNQLMEKSREPVQQLILDSRKKLKISGVSDVDSFSETIVAADTCMGRLTVKGEQLKINKLNTDDGELVLEGRINSLEYTKKKEKGSFFENIFR